MAFRLHLFARAPVSHHQYFCSNFPIFIYFLVISFCIRLKLQQVVYVCVYVHAKLFEWISLNFAAPSISLKSFANYKYLCFMSN